MVFVFMSKLNLMDPLDAAMQINRKTLRGYYLRQVITIAVIWTLLDFSRFLTLIYTEDASKFPYVVHAPGLLRTRVLVMLLFSAFMSWLLIFPLKETFRRKPLWLGVAVKSLVIAIISAITMLVQFYVIYLFIYRLPFGESTRRLVDFATNTLWVYHNLSSRFMITVLTLLALEINEKYSPGVFTDIFLGKYIQPKEQMRIIAFIDLKNSTPTAEALGHQKYFFFIRDFIHHISSALLLHDGLIYQYIGDEIVASWLLTKKNREKSLKAIETAQRIILDENGYYRRRYGVVPDFRVGLHCGMVMVGEIGLVKKDIAISGDAMNTTARIRSLAGEVDQDILASEYFVQQLGISPEVAQLAGSFELKGKAEPMRVYGLNLIRKRASQVRVPGAATTDSV
ncbi:MAG: adenylate/guanylate cyclase domain-containing protein [Sphingobacteriales bacterium]|nr:MAG: adenylate/guanylate cyclase domain-containing protein [Sphingobacteriales bacterium]